MAALRATHRFCRWSAAAAPAILCWCRSTRSRPPVFPGRLPRSEVGSPRSCSAGHSSRSWRVWMRRRGALGRRSPGSGPWAGALPGIACTGSTAARCSQSWRRQPRSIPAGPWWRSCFDWGAMPRTTGCSSAPRGIDHERYGSRASLPAELPRRQSRHPGRADPDQRPPAASPPLELSGAPRSAGRRPGSSHGPASRRSAAGPSAARPTFPDLPRQDRQRF
jgi:hypothetical protein